MKKGIILVLMIMIAGSILWQGCCGGNEETTVDVSPAAGPPASQVTIEDDDGKSPVPTTPAQTSMPSPTAQATATPGPTATQTPEPYPTHSPVPTGTPTPTPSYTASPTPGPTISPTPKDPNEPVSFPDADLEAAIRNAISKSSGSIYLSDLTGLTTLNASNKGISNLAGLQFCTALSNLDLSYNEIRDIYPLVANAGLGAGDNIHLEYNPLSSASYGYVKQLTDRGISVIWGSL